MKRKGFDPARANITRQAAAESAASAIPPARPDPAASDTLPGLAADLGPAPASAPSPAAATDRPLSVSDLAALIEGAVRSGVPKPIRVAGEISQFTHRQHWYFTLKDAGAAVSCVMFHFAARRAGFEPAVGQAVVATGYAEFYVPQGRISFRVDKLEPVGVGALDLAFRKLCEQLSAQGYFAPERKRPLPLFPRRVAVVTSRTGAALQDVKDTARRRCPAVELILVDTVVQGAGAAEKIAAAIDAVSRAARPAAIDALILTRGGGSIEDLWAFNERPVADALLRCSIPVVAAIGHEVDTTIAELVADLRAATPTQAAMRVIPDAAALREQLDASASRLGSALLARLDAARRDADSLRRQLLAAGRHQAATRRRRVDSAALRLERLRPANRLADLRTRLGTLEERLRAVARARLVAARTRLAAIDLVDAARDAIAQRRQRLDNLDRQLRLVGPDSVLGRGYSITTTTDGRLVDSAASVRDGDRLLTRLRDGTIASTVGDPPQPSPPPHAAAPPVSARAPMLHPAPLPPASSRRLPPESPPTPEPSAPAPPGPSPRVPNPPPGHPSPPSNPIPTNPPRRSRRDHTPDTGPGLFGD